MTSSIRALVTSIVLGAVAAAGISAPAAAQAPAAPADASLQLTIDDPPTLGLPITMTVLAGLVAAGGAMGASVPNDCFSDDCPRVDPLRIGLGVTALVAGLGMVAALTWTLARVAHRRQLRHELYYGGAASVGYSLRW